MTKSAVVLVPGPQFSGGLVSSALQQINADLSSVDILACTPGSTADPGAQYQTAVCTAHEPTVLSKTYFSLAGKMLMPGGALLVQDCSSQMDPVGRAEFLKNELLLSGFFQQEVLPATVGVVVRAQKPTVQVGAKVALRRPIAVPPPPAGKVVVTNTFEDDEELIDDEELLTEDDKIRPVVAKSDDCEVGAGRKACKNCSCGRAEAEAAGEKVVLTPEMLENPVSSCGNCSLGDAFRCAGCPYKGLPAFEPGKRIELSKDFLAADV